MHVHTKISSNIYRYTVKVKLPEETVNTAVYQPCSQAPPSFPSLAFVHLHVITTHYAVPHLEIGGHRHLLFRRASTRWSSPSPPQPAPTGGGGAFHECKCAEYQL